MAPVSEAPTSRGECTYDPLVAFMAKFENVRTDAGTDSWAALTIEEKLKRHIIDGVKKNLDRHLEEALLDRAPLLIINDVLLDGMRTVGELFGAGKMQLPFVLQSAEVMKAAVAYLEPRMEKTEGSKRGSILLATVAGDVHDIGKNLVDIILTNNGFRVVNIGIKQPIQAILDAAEAHHCQVIGMSGLLVKSTLIMKENLLEMNARDKWHLPVILGGAALTRAYVEQDLRSIYRGNVYYAQDAFEGLHLMNGIGREVPNLPAEPDLPRATSHRVDLTDPSLFAFDGTRSDIEPLGEVVPLPFYGAKRFEKFDIFEIYRYINPIALFRGQWQYRRPDAMSNVEFTAWLEEEARPIFDSLQRELSRVLQPKVTWGYFPCHGEGNDLIIYEADGKTERLRFNFPRQREGRRLCLSDYFRRPGEPLDTVGFHIVTVGHEISQYERDMFSKGDYRRYLYVHGMGVETAEALAEYWHRQMRHELGIGADDPEDMKLLYSAKYRGARYSFGYPACPNLEDQAKLFTLLEPEKIGVSLSEEFMLVPEQSTSAIIVHHPEAKYFQVR